MVKSKEWDWKLRNMSICKIYLLSPKRNLLVGRYLHWPIYHYNRIMELRV